MRAIRILIHGALVLAVGSCQRGRDIAGVGDSTFVQTMAALHRIEVDPTLDSAGKAAARRAVLQDRGLSPEQLERAARALADDPARAATIWSRIDSTARQPAAPPPE